MILKKGCFCVLFGLALVSSASAQLVTSALNRARSGVGGDVGITVSYNHFNPSFLGFGLYAKFGGYDYDADNTAHSYKFGMHFGSTTMNYQMENPFTLADDINDYWQKSSYVEVVNEYAFQFGFVDLFAFRLGVEISALMASAYAEPPLKEDPSGEFSVGLSGIGGLVLFPKAMVSIVIDACPGVRMDPLNGDDGVVDHPDIFVFTMPIRLSIAWNPFVKN